MATSGSKSITVTSWDKLVFNWTLSSQSVASNTSTVTWSMKLVATSSGRIDSSTSKDWKVTVNGTVYTGTNTVGISNNSTKTLASGTTVISHNADGTKDFSFAFQQEFNITFSGSSIGTIGGNGSGSLPTIARASQPSCVTWPEHTQNVGEFGDEISIHMNRASSAFTHTVRYQFGSQSGTIATNVDTGTKWVIPLSLMNLLPNHTKGSGTIYVDTYNGSTKVGTKYCGFTATVPASIKPSCALTITDPTGNADTYGAFVKGISKMQVKVTPTLAYTSPIKTYSTTANGSKYTSASFTTGVIKSSGTLTASTTITDGRGRTATASKSITVLDYSTPSISKLVVGRCDADGTSNMQGEYVAVTFSASATALNNKNNVTCTIRYKKSSETSFTDADITVTNKYAVTNHQYIFEADTGHSYDIELSVVDNHSTTTRSTSASTAFTLMHFGANGTSIGLLKVAEKDNAVDVGGDMYLDGHAVYGAHGLSDTRYDNETPGWYMQTHGRGVVWEFKDMKSIQFTAPTTTFAPVQTIIPWKDQSGGYPRQVAYEGTKRWMRIGTSDTTWGAWRTDTSSASGDVPSDIQAQLDAKAPLSHTHDVATTSAAGFMSIADKKLVNRLRATSIGSVSGKTIPEFQDLLVEWIEGNLSTPNAVGYFASSGFYSLWNNDDTTTTLSGGSQWLVTIESYYGLSSYVQLKISTYSDKYVYYVARSNSKWGKLRKVMFTDDTAASAKTLTNLTASVTELNYVKGATSNIQTQLNKLMGTTLYEVDPSAMEGIYCNGNTTADSVNSVTLADSTKKYKRLKIYAHFPKALASVDFPLDASLQSVDATFGDKIGGIMVPAGDHTSGANKHYLYKLNFCVKETSSGWTLHITDSGWLGLGIPNVSATNYTNGTTTKLSGTEYPHWNQRHNNNYVIYKVVGYEE